jgi:hypothetical protein
VNYRNLPPPPSPRYSPPNPVSPATESISYVPDLPILPKYPPSSLTKHFDHLAPSAFPHSPHSPHSPSYVRRSNRHSLTPSELPEYRSIYSSHMDGHSPAADSTWRDDDDQYRSHQHPSASTSKSSPPGQQLAALSIKTENRLLSPYSPGAQNSINHSSTGSSGSSHERPRDSASLSSYSGLSSPSPSTPTSNGTWLPPAPPPSPNFFFPGSRSVARPRVSSKITNSEFKKRRSQSKLRTGRSQISPTSSVSPSFEVSPVSPIVPMPNHSGTWPDEGASVLSDDHKRNLVPKAPPEIFVFPTARSRAQPKISSRPRSSKSSTSSKSRDDNQGRSRFIETLFKRKSKAKKPNITPMTNMSTMVSNLVASPVESTASKGARISTELNHESTSTGHPERTRSMKSKRGSYPLDPYNSVLLDKLSLLVLLFLLFMPKSVFSDRLTGELLSRLNPTPGSPSFHDYGTAPPSSILDLGCGQG